MDYRINKLEDRGQEFANTPATNTTLSLLYGPEDGVEKVANDTALYGPAFVAAQKALQAKKEEVDKMITGT
jgi:hypothetical protein